MKYRLAKSQPINEKIITSTTTTPTNINTTTAKTTATDDEISSNNNVYNDDDDDGDHSDAHPEQMITATSAQFRVTKDATNIKNKHVRESIHPSICPSIHISTHSSIHPSIHPFLLITRNVYLMKMAKWKYLIDEKKGMFNVENLFVIIP